MSETKCHTAADDRYAELARAFRVCRMIATESLSLSELAERLHCHPRTIRRMIHQLRSVGVDITSGRLAWHAADIDDDWNDLQAARYKFTVTYRLDRRAWSGLLYLPDDGSTAALAAEGGGQ